MFKEEVCLQIYIINSSTSSFTLVVTLVMYGTAEWRQL